MYECTFSVTLILEQKKWIETEWNKKDIEYNFSLRVMWKLTHDAILHFLALQKKYFSAHWRALIVFHFILTQPWKEILKL